MALYRQQKKNNNLIENLIKQKTKQIRAQIELKKLNPIQKGYADTRKSVDRLVRLGRLLVKSSQSLSIGSSQISTDCKIPTLRKCLLQAVYR